LPDRDHGAFEDAGFRQTEVAEAGRWGVWVGAGGWRYYLWSWVNPRPEHDLVRIDIEAREAVAEVGGLCLGFAQWSDLHANGLAGVAGLRVTELGRNWVLPATATVITDPAERRRVLAVFAGEFNRRRGPDSPWPEAVLDEWAERSPLAKVTFTDPG
jgi:hypothetical protein